ncbi:MAG: hypothetical protein PHC75_08005 [Burkholderiales bacterium]|nr:hypothetical protein [Burkholderiales bacterium]
MKLKLNDTEFIDTDKLRNVCTDKQDIITLYYAPESKRFFTVIPSGYKSEFDEVEEIDSSEAYEFLIDNNTSADFINKRISTLFSDKPQLQEIL